MLIFTFGILQFSLCWRIIPALIELVKFIKQPTPSVSGMLGVAYIADRSRHPEQLWPAGLEPEYEQHTPVNQQPGKSVAGERDETIDPIKAPDISGGDDFGFSANIRILSFTRMRKLTFIGILTTFIRMKNVKLRKNHFKSATIPGVKFIPLLPVFINPWAIAKR